jgi:hypothetical protein
VLLVVAASKTALKNTGGLAEAKDLGSSIVVNGADEVDLLTSSAAVKLGAEGEFAVALGSNVVVDMGASSGEEAIAIRGNSEGNRRNVVGRKVRRGSARVLVNGLTSRSALTGRDP